jgi:hypothetical protein
MDEGFEQIQELKFIQFDTLKQNKDLSQGKGFLGWLVVGNIDFHRVVVKQVKSEKLKENDSANLWFKF